MYTHTHTVQRQQIAKEKISGSFEGSAASLLTEGSICDSSYNINKNHDLLMNLNDEEQSEPVKHSCCFLIS